jgi:hypothetical protein
VTYQAAIRPADEKRRIWSLIVQDHTASFNEVIRLAGKHPNDMCLKARRLLADLTREARAPHFPDTAHGYGSIGVWGQNGQGPAIRVLLQSAQFRDQTLCERALADRIAA